MEIPDLQKIKEISKYRSKEDRSIKLIENYLSSIFREIYEKAFLDGALYMQGEINRYMIETYGK